MYVSQISVCMGQSRISQTRGLQTTGVCDNYTEDPWRYDNISIVQYK